MRTKFKVALLNQIVRDSAIKPTFLKKKDGSTLIEFEDHEIDIISNLMREHNLDPAGDDFIDTMDDLLRLYQTEEKDENN